MKTEQFIDILSRSGRIKTRTREDLINYSKTAILETPDGFMQLHLDWALKNEEYEIAKIIKEECEKRGFKLNFHVETI